MLLSGRDFRRSRCRHKTYSYFRGLNPHGIAKEISKRNRLRDSVRCIRIIVYGFDAIAKAAERIFDALSGESRSLSAGYEMALLTASPFTVTCWLDIALELKSCGGLFCLLHGDFQHVCQIRFSPCQSPSSLFDKAQ
jgi:hypothetical protein